MMLPAWHEEPIGKTHDRRLFDCGIEALNDYLCRFARQNHEAGMSKTFVAVQDDDPRRILGYYSVSAAQIKAEKVPSRAIRQRGHYPVPAIRLARLAIDRRFHRLGLGGQLLLSAGERALKVSREVGVRVLTIDAKDERAVVWYEQFGAVRLFDRPLTLILPLETIKAAILGSPGSH